MAGKIKVVSFGIGVIGSAVARTMLDKKSDWIEIVGAIDSDPQKIGRDLGEVVGAGKKSGISISSDVEGTLKAAEPDIVVHTTSSFLSAVSTQLKQILQNGVDIVSSCEEISFPYDVDEGLFRELDTVARNNDCTLVGTGINPGFVMDVLPIVLSAPCVDIERIHVTRQMNAANRRVPFQKKIGAGLSKTRFVDAIASGTISGHVGLSQSIAMVADAIGWQLQEIEVKTPEPVVLAKEVASDWITIAPGTVAGTRQQALGKVGGKAVITYDFAAYIAAPEEFDAVEINGTPKISFRSTPCINGDAGTIAMLINSIPLVIEAKSGLLTMKDLKLPHAVKMPIPVE